MTRYAKQNDYYSCGAAALANALKWDGHSVSWKRQKQDFVKKVNCGPAPRGTGARDLYYALKKVFGKRIRYFINPRLKILDKILDKKGLVIIELYYPKWHNGHGHGHYFILDGRTPQGYWTVNLKLRSSKARNWISRNTLKKLLYLRKRNGMFVIAPHPDRFPEAYVGTRWEKK